MSVASVTQRVSIRPGVGILSVLRHLNYRPWFAIAEFVDNPLQSFLDYRGDIERVAGRRTHLTVSIELDVSDDGCIVVRDDAAGIHEADYRRAFRPAELPADRSGLCEFGMGMKSAACWFSPTWSVRTSALGEPVERTVSFDIDRIVEDSIEELDVESRPVAPEAHFTEITLRALHINPRGRTVSKIKEHLASIYRVHIRDSTLKLLFNGEELSYEDTEVLRAPYAKDDKGEPKLWRKPIQFDFGKGLKATGFGALRKTGSTTRAGFALFRRNRLIEGGADETYRPEFIFGKPNSFVFQRLFGELHLEGFEISHTKDGFRWEEHEEAFLELLREELDAEPLPLLRQARQHRARPDRNALEEGARTAARRAAEGMERGLGPVIERQLADEPDGTDPPAELPAARRLAHQEREVEFEGCLWLIRIELSYDPGVGDWVDISDRPSRARAGTGRQRRKLGIRLSLEHPFMQMFGGVDAETIEPLLRVAIAICLAEITSRESGVLHATTIRRNINDLLRNALAHPAAE